MEFLYTDDASDYLSSKGLRVSPNTLKWFRATGQGPRSAVLSGKIVWRVSDLELWIATRCAETVRGGVPA